MSLKKCEKCGEMVDDAKAFCPGCGYSFVDEEEREEDSEFDVSGGTMNISESAYDVLLSDMGLNISETTEAPEQQAAGDLAPVHQTKNGTPENAASGKKFLIVLVLAFIVLLIAAIVFIVF